MLGVYHFAVAVTTCATSVCGLKRHHVLARIVTEAKELAEAGSRIGRDETVLLRLVEDRA